MRLMPKIEYRIVPKGTKFTVSDKLRLSIIIYILDPIQVCRYPIILKTWNHITLETLEKK